MLESLYSSAVGGRGTLGCLNDPCSQMGINWGTKISYEDALGDGDAVGGPPGTYNDEIGTVKVVGRIDP